MLCLSTLQSIVMHDWLLLECKRAWYVQHLPTNDIVCYHYLCCVCSEYGGVTCVAQTEGHKPQLAAGHSCPCCSFVLVESMRTSCIMQRPASVDCNVQHVGAVDLVCYIVTLKNIVSQGFISLTSAPASTCRCLK